MARTTPISKAWMSLVRPLGMILPRAVATISTLPTEAQTSAAQNTEMIVAPIARPMGEGGVSVISSAAGRKASSYSPRRTGCFGKAMTFLADVMNACLQTMERRISTVAADQVVVGAVFDDAAALDGDDAVGAPHGRQAMGYDEHSPPSGDL